jgi:hypothetical protein
VSCWVTDSGVQQACTCVQQDESSVVIITEVAARVAPELAPQYLLHDSQKSRNATATHMPQCIRQISKPA